DRVPVGEDEGRLGVRDGVDLDVESGPGQPVAERPADGLLVVHDQDGFGHWGSSRFQVPSFKLEGRTWNSSRKEGADDARTPGPVFERRARLELRREQVPDRRLLGQPDLDQDGPARPEGPGNLVGDPAVVVEAVDAAVERRSRLEVADAGVEGRELRTGDVWRVADHQVEGPLAHRGEQVALDE